MADTQLQARVAAGIQPQARVVAVGIQLQARVAAVAGIRPQVLAAAGVDHRTVEVGHRTAGVVARRTEEAAADTEDNGPTPNGL